MITYLYGTDGYRIKEYLAEHAAGAIVGEEGLKMQGLFDQAPVILYDPPAKLKIPDDLEVFVVTEKKPKTKKDLVELNPLKGPEIASWIKDEAKRQGFVIDADAVNLLAQNYYDTWQTKLELDLLCSYAYETKHITAKMVMLLLPKEALSSIFGMTDAIAAKRKSDAVLLLTEQLEGGIDPYYLFSMIVGQFRNMIAPKRAGVHPYAASRAAGFAKRFAADELKTMYRRLAALEHSVKGGKYDITDGLYQFIFSL